jgi:hypothetical protein
VRLPHALTANRPLRPDAAHLGGAAAKALAAQKKLSSLAAQLGQQRSSAVGEAAVPVFPLGTAAPTIAHTHASVLDSDREAPMLQAIRQLVANGEMNAFNMYDLEIVRDQLHRFRRNLPRVQPFYAMKCNPDARVVALLAAEGCNFDCASKAEIQIALDNGATADRIIFANPCKQPSHVAFAHSVGVNVSTFDGADELYKIAALQPGADLVFRVQVDDSHAVCTMSQKYGAPLAHLPELLTVAQSLGLNVIGVSYHVGARRRARAPAVRRARATGHVPPRPSAERALAPSPAFAVRRLWLAVGAALRRRSEDGARRLRPRRAARRHLPPPRHWRRLPRHDRAAAARRRAAPRARGGLDAQGAGLRGDRGGAAAGAR